MVDLLSLVGKNVMRCDVICDYGLIASYLAYTTIRLTFEKHRLQDDVSNFDTYNRFGLRCDTGDLI